MQRYKCIKCGLQFQSKRRKSRLQNKMWKEYICGKQTLKDLSGKYHRSNKWINQQLNSVKISPVNLPKPQPIVIIADVTFFERSYGIMVIREPNLKKNIYWKEVSTETPDIYWQARNRIEQQGFTLKAAVIDGKRGVKEVFLDLPVQMCQFHQVAIINRYLTRKPKLDAGKELRKTTLLLTGSNEKEFSNLLDNWHEK